MSKSKCPKCGQVIDKKTKECKQCGFSHIESVTTKLFKGPAATAKVKEEIVVEPIQEGEETVLVIKKGPVIGQRISLNKEKVLIGRDPQSDIFLNDITVSRKHAKLIILKGKTEIKDIGSLNGTYVNSERAESVSIKSGDEIQIGKFVLVFLSK